MAFTASELNQIVMITGVDRITLDQYLADYATYITATVEDDVRTQIQRWEAGAGTEFTSIEPRESNQGVRINSEAEKRDIRNNIANLLFLTEVMRSGAGMLLRA
jgi:hypothetical protein